jgi:hypothetical protein
MVVGSKAEEKLLGGEEAAEDASAGTLQGVQQPLGQDSCRVGCHGDLQLLKVETWPRDKRELSSTLSFTRGRWAGCSL